MRAFMIWIGRGRHRMMYIYYILYICAKPSTRTVENWAVFFFTEEEDSKGIDDIERPDANDRMNFSPRGSRTSLFSTC